MSHITELKTDIAFKDPGLLDEALAACAATRQGCKIRPDKKGNRFTVEWGDLMAYRANALSFVKKGDAYVTEGDRFLVEEQIDAFLDDLQVAYQQVAVTKWMRQNRFATPTVQRKDTEVVVTARRW